MGLFGKFSTCAAAEETANEMNPTLKAAIVCLKTRMKGLLFDNTLTICKMESQ
jgi:hypothetical protein